MKTVARQVEVVVSANQLPPDADTIQIRQDEAVIPSNPTSEPYTVAARVQVPTPRTLRFHGAAGPVLSPVETVEIYVPSECAISAVTYYD